ncbi:MAG TPA: hypothetical protein VM532_08945 [Burkholderiales bacterium]|nr:hypothetical protein [Burkholderiales bacterium]
MFGVFLKEGLMAMKWGFKAAIILVGFGLFAGAAHSQTEESKSSASSTTVAESVGERASRVASNVGHKVETVTHKVGAAIEKGAQKTGRALQRAGQWVESKVGPGNHSSDD